MTFRTRLLLVFTAAVVASVGLVEWLVFRTTREAFERAEAQRVNALVEQFRREFDRRREAIVRAVNGIAASDAVLNIAIASDRAPYYGEAAALASSSGLDLLELVAGDGAIISSAEWPARFGYKEEWLVPCPPIKASENICEPSGFQNPGVFQGASNQAVTGLASGTDWKSRGAFLRREELPDGVTLALAAVSEMQAADRKVYVAGGQRLDRGFLSSLVLPEGMRVLQYRNLSSGFSPGELIAPAGGVADAQTLRPIIAEALQEPREFSRTVGSGAAAETIRALPLTSGKELLGVLLVGSSRRDLVAVESALFRTGLLVAMVGILVGIVVAYWATARVTRPVRALAAGAAKVAAGNWGATVETTSTDEIGQLARAFNRMTRELVAQRERLVQAERVAAWRELARRLAHELKNPLFPLQITVENMRRAHEAVPEQFEEVFREGTGTLLAELANLKQIIGRFSDFAKMPAPEMQPVNLNDLAREAMRLFEPQLAHAGIAPRLELDPQLRPVPADPEQITRVLRNLVLNAIDAMPQGGALTVRTAAQNGGVRMEVADTGQGLTAEECERLFTPYYTTKTHGTGLGLAIVQSVISDHKGRIAVESQPGKGTTFRIEMAGD
jgi:two-component system nitrogen regulation sensor histidine kinase NtrY